MWMAPLVAAHGCTSLHLRVRVALRLGLMDRLSWLLVGWLAISAIMQTHGLPQFWLNASGRRSSWPAACST